MNKNILILILLITTSTFSQKTTKKKENAVYGKAKFRVLKSDGTTRHGEYKITSYTPPFRNLMKGNYENGKKEGLWIELFDKSGSPTRISGLYKSGNKIGEWKYFDSDGELTQVFDFDKMDLTTNSECGDNKDYEVKVEGHIETKKLTCPPTRIGGLKIFTKDLYREITKKSPFEINSSGRTNISINETLSFYINTDNNIEEIEYTGIETNEELAEVITNYLSENNEGWISGKIDNDKVNAKIIIPIRIRMMF